MRRRAARLLAIAGFVGLVVLHLDFWRPQRERLWFGWLPEELAYRLGFCLLAWLYMMFVVACVWRAESDS